MSMPSGPKPGCIQVEKTGHGEVEARLSGIPTLAPRAREALARLMEGHPYRNVLLSHEEAVMRVAASLPQMREALDALAGAGQTPEAFSDPSPAGPGRAGEILSQFLEFVAFSTPEMKRLVAGEP